MSNKDLLKQAIAEAKTIREAAIANAKEALEESLTPHLKEMLAQKLQEMNDEDEMDEYGMEHNDRDLDGDGKVDAKDTRLAEAEEEEAPEEEAETEEEETEEEDVDVKDMSVEELKDLIRDIVSQEVGHDESEEEMPGEEAPEGEDLTGMDSEEEEIDINELLAELAEMEGNTEVLSEEEKAYFEMKGFIDLIDKASAKLKDIGEKSPAIQSMIKTIDSLQTKFKELGLSNSFTKGGSSMKEESNESEDLNEAMKTIKVLRSQLQEVNLLNAKLLYVNKVFKANNLSESQKVNVVAAFDKAETVKEVKLVFETVSKNVVTKPATIKEHKSFASKATGTSQTAGRQEIISEVSDTVRRMQKLAGIIK
jgi:flagellar biosynthesis/type III secretory pathway chaperone